MCLSHMYRSVLVFGNETSTTVTYTYRHTLPLRYALPISPLLFLGDGHSSICRRGKVENAHVRRLAAMTYISIRTGAIRSDTTVDRVGGRSEEHQSALQSLMRISYAVFCLKQKRKIRKGARRNDRHSRTDRKWD